MSAFEPERMKDLPSHKSRISTQFFLGKSFVDEPLQGKPRGVKAHPTRQAMLDFINTPWKESLQNEFAWRDLKTVRHCLNDVDEAWQVMGTVFDRFTASHTNMPWVVLTGSVDDSRGADGVRQDLVFARLVSPEDRTGIATLTREQSQCFFNLMCLANDRCNLPFLPFVETTHKVVLGTLFDTPPCRPVQPRTFAPVNVASVSLVLLPENGPQSPMGDKADFYVSTQFCEYLQRLVKPTTTFSVDFDLWPLKPPSPHQPSAAASSSKRGQKRKAESESPPLSDNGSDSGSASSEDEDEDESDHHSEASNADTPKDGKTPHQDSDDEPEAEAPPAPRPSPAVGPSAPLFSPALAATSAAQPSPALAGASAAQPSPALKGAKARPSPKSTNKSPSLGKKLTVKGQLAQLKDELNDFLGATFPDDDDLEKEVQQLTVHTQKEALTDADVRGALKAVLCHYKRFRTLQPAAATPPEAAVAQGVPFAAADAHRVIDASMTVEKVYPKLLSLQHTLADIASHLSPLSAAASDAAAAQLVQHAAF